MGIGIGTHDVEIVETGFSVTRSDKEFLSLLFRDANGDTIKGTLWLTSAAWPRTAETLRKLGWDAEARGFAFDEFNEDPSPIAGAECEIVVVEEDYQGTRDLKVKWINERGEKGRVPRLDRGKGKLIAQALAERLKSQPAGDCGTPPGDDDIPF